MVFITGDTHGSFSRFTKKRFPEQTGLTKDDIVMIAGDFGGIWYSAGDTAHAKKEKGILTELNQRAFTTAFVPGNHENYDRLMSDEFPTRFWNHGYAKEIQPSIWMLLRGEIYEINGAAFFAFGGASSHDISDGILDPEDPDRKAKEKLLKRNEKRMYRVKGVSWWDKELPTQEEMDRGLENLDKHHWTVDYVISHCAPTSVQKAIGIQQADCLTEYLEQIRKRLTYKKWFFGHYHHNKQVTDKDILLYEQIVRIEAQSNEGQ